MLHPAWPQVDLLQSAKTTSVPFRFMMLIDKENEVYMLDRDNCVFKVHGLRFLHRKDLRRHLRDTLLDGVRFYLDSFDSKHSNPIGRFFHLLSFCCPQEMVIDKVEGKEIPRYLCYDIIKFEGQDVGKSAFYPVRLSCIENEIVNPRYTERGQSEKEKEREESERK